MQHVLETVTELGKTYLPRAIFQLNRSLVLQTEELNGVGESNSQI